MHPVLAKRIFDSDTAGITDELCQMRDWERFSIAYPLLDIGFRGASGAELRIRMHCEDWNDLPPMVELLDFGGRFLMAKPANSDVFNPGPHVMTGRPFICMRGAREYHVHESHRLDPWDDLKGQPDFRLGEILTQIWRAWKRSH